MCSIGRCATILAQHAPPKLAATKLICKQSASWASGMAVVYLARDPFTKRQVAVKMLLMPSQQFEIGRQLRARFEREAEIVAAVEHPHIVPIHDLASTTSSRYRHALHDRRLARRPHQQRGRLSLAETAGIIRKLASALDDAHQRGVVPASSRRTSSSTGAASRTSPISAFANLTKPPRTAPAVARASAPRPT